MRENGVNILGVLEYKLQVQVLGYPLLSHWSQQITVLDWTGPDWTGPHIRSITSSPLSPVGPVPYLCHRSGNVIRKIIMETMRRERGTPHTAVPPLKLMFCRSAGNFTFPADMGCLMFDDKIVIQREHIFEKRCVAKHTNIYVQNDVRGHNIFRT
jgi:hypothetical protein